MIVTKNQLKQLILEELGLVLKEQGPPVGPRKEDSYWIKQETNKRAAHGTIQDCTHSFWLVSRNDPNTKIEGSKLTSTGRTCDKARRNAWTNFYNTLKKSNIDVNYVKWFPKRT